MTTPHDEGFTPLAELPLLERSFVSGAPSGDRLSVQYFHRERDNMFIAKARFGPLAEGPPGHAHGGSMAALLDETMGLCAWFAGHRVVAARLTLDFKKMIPLGSEATVVAWVKAEDGRKITTGGRIESGEGSKKEIHAEGEGLFITLDEEKFLGSTRSA